MTYLSCIQIVKFYCLMSYQPDLFVFSKYNYLVIIIFQCRTNGKECLIGCDRNVLNNPPSIGSVIVVKCSGTYSTGTLRNAFYWRQREDISWNSLAQQDKETIVIYHRF